MTILLSKTNGKRWIVEGFCFLISLMVLDDGTFAIILAATFLLLETLLLFPFIIKTKMGNLLAQYWSPLVVFAFDFTIVSIFNINLA